MSSLGFNAKFMMKQSILVFAGHYGSLLVIKGHFG